MTQRDGKGREVGGGFRLGNTCTPVADSCWCMAKPIQYCEVKKIIIIIKKEKKRNIHDCSNSTIKLNSRTEKKMGINLQKYSISEWEDSLLYRCHFWYLFYTLSIYCNFLLNAIFKQNPCEIFFGLWLSFWIMSYWF